MSILCLVACVLMPTLVQASDPLAFKGAFPSGETFTSTVYLTGAQPRGYISEGDQVAIVNLTDPGAVPAPFAAPLIARVPINATVMALVRHDRNTDDRKVFIAGGSFGLRMMDALEPAPGGSCFTSPCALGAGSCFAVTRVDDRAIPGAGNPEDTNERWCWDVGIGQVHTPAATFTYVLALFSAQQDQGGSQLRIYRRSGNPPALITSIDLTSAKPRAFGYALDTLLDESSGAPDYGDKVYIAMGTGGVMVVDLAPLATGGAPILSQGQIFVPPLLGVSPPLQVTYAGQPEPGLVRDIAVAEDGSVYAAADNWGIVEIDPLTGMAAGTSSSPGIVRLVPNAGVPPALDEMSFADHIDAVVTHVGEQPFVNIVAGGYDLTAMVEPLAAWLTYGRMSYAVGPGGDLPIAYSNSLSRRDGLFFFRKPSGAILAASDQVHKITNASAATTNPELNGGHFILRPSPTEPDTLWFYDQAWLHGGSQVDPVSGTRVGFQWLKYPAPNPSSGPVRELFHTGIGQDVITTTHLILDPDVVLAHFDAGVGAVFAAGAIDISTRTCPKAAPYNEAGAGVFSPKAHWLDMATNEEWFLGSIESSACRRGFTLNRVTSTSATPPLQFEAWNLRSPKQPDCYLTRNYHRSTAYRSALHNEDRIFGLFDGGFGGANLKPTMWGGVVYSTDTLKARANVVGFLQGQPADCQNQVTSYPQDAALFPDLGSFPPPLADLTSSGTACYATGYPINASGGTAENYLGPVVIHPELALWTSSSAQAGAFVGPAVVRDYQVSSGAMHSFGIVAAGQNCLDTGSNPDFSKPMLAIVDLDDDGTVPPSYAGCPPHSYAYANCSTPAPRSFESVHVAYAPFTKGLAASIQVVECSGHRFAIVGDFGGRLLIFDVTADPAIPPPDPPVTPTYRQAWIVPPSMLDGYIDNVSDVAVDDSALQSTGKMLVYLSIYRIGIVELTLVYNTHYNPLLPCTQPNGQPFVLPLQSFPNPAVGDYYASGVRKRDTPGLAHSLEFISNAAGKGFLEADKQGGLRIYGDF